MSEQKTIRVLGSGGDYEDHPNPNYKPSSLAQAPGSVIPKRNVVGMVEKVGRSRKADGDGRRYRLVTIMLRDQDVGTLADAALVELKW